jgi:hypothetical protein
MSASEISDTEWWREILLLLESERIAEEFFDTAQITPYRLDYELLIADRHASICSILHSLSCTDDEIAGLPGPISDYTERHRYDDWPGALSKFKSKYLSEIELLEQVRQSLDIEQLRYRLITRHRLPV